MATFDPELGPVILHFAALLQRFTEDEFFEFCQRHEEWVIERSDDGDLIILPLCGGETGRKSALLTMLFGRWVEADGTGIGFGALTGFRLPNGAVRAPDLAWLRRERWESLTRHEQETFAPLCPDFVVELRSRTDRLKPLQEKMEEYIANGAQLGWLIDPAERKVYVYRPDTETVCLDNPERVAGDPVLPGFVLELARVWA